MKCAFCGGERETTQGPCVNFEDDVPPPPRQECAFPVPTFKSLRARDEASLG